ncbi:MAG: glycosyltransferase family 39 protein [Bacteroidota bacterium]
MKNIHFSKQTLCLSAILTLIWGVTIFLVNPLGDFPLNDDFSFGRTVYNLTEQNRLQFDDWLSMTLIVQVLWGGLFTKLFGFSFTVLRFSTLVLTLFGTLAFNQIAKELDLSGKQALIFTFAAVFNPLFFSLSYTFMTDVPFACMVIFSILYFIKFFKSDLLPQLFLASIFSLAAIFIRQLGLMLPMSFALVWLLGKKLSWRNTAIALTPLVLSITVFFIYQQWFATTQGIPETYGTITKLFKRIGHGNFLSVSFNRIGLLFIYLGIFLLPINIILFKKIKKRKQLAWILATSVIGLAIMLPVWEKFPWGNIFYNFGLGPKILKDGYFFINISPTLSTEMIRLITSIGIGCGLFFLYNIYNNLGWQKIKANKYFLIRFFILSNIILYGGFLLLDVYFFDRYFIPLILLAIIFLMTLNTSKKIEKFRWLAILTPLLVIILFSISATHDYLSWNRARWEALNYLTEEKKISPKKIDGGFEFNGWHKTAEEKNEDGPKSWWWVADDEYVVSFGNLGWFNKYRAFPYKTYLPPATDTIFILKKK